MEPYGVWEHWLLSELDPLDDQRGGGQKGAYKEVHYLFGNGVRTAVGWYERPGPSGTQRCLRVEMGRFGPLPSGAGDHPKHRLELTPVEAAELLSVLQGDAEKASIKRQRPGMPIKRLRLKYAPCAGGGIWMYGPHAGSGVAMQCPMDDNDALAIAKLAWRAQVDDNEAAYGHGLLTIVRCHGARVSKEKERRENG